VAHRLACPTIPIRRVALIAFLGHRWGLHNLRHSLSNWLVNKAKENPKTVQGILGHSRIQTTLDLYADEDLDVVAPWKCSAASEILWKLGCYEML
jgi:integrase